VTSRRLRSEDLALVAAGSAAGAVARWSLSHAEAGLLLPWATLGINVVGAFLLGALPTAPAVRRSRRATVLLGPRVLSGFTTVSTWAGQVRELAHDGHIVLAGVLVLGTVAGALLAAHVGRRLARRPEPEDVLT
jgi:CrcB protein